MAIAALLGTAGMFSACHFRPSEPPCGGVRPFESYPASHMSAIWRVPGTEPLILGSHLVVRGAGSADREVDPASGRRARTVLPASFGWLPEASRDDLWIGQNDAPHVTAVDPGSLRERWKAGCSDGERPCYMRGVRAGSVAVFAGVIEERTGASGVFGVSASSGDELWRTASFYADGLALKLAADTEHVFVLDEAMLRVFRAPTGEALWTRALARSMVPLRSRIITAAQGVVALWEGEAKGHILVLDADSGDEEADIPWGRMAGELRLEGGVLYVTSFWDGEGMEVAAFEALSGQEKWRSRSVGSWVLPPLSLAEDALFVLRADSSNLAMNGEGTEIVALDRESGQQVFAHPVGKVEHMALLPQARGGSVLAFGVPGGEIIGMQRTAAVPAPITVMISGRLTANVPEALELQGRRVEVGSAVVRADDRGRFSARVSALGAVKVRLLDVPRRESTPPLKAEPVLLYVGGESHGSVNGAGTVNQAGAANGAGELHVETTIVIEEVSPWPRD